MKLFSPELNIAIEDIEDETSEQPISLEELASFPFDNYMRGLNTSLEHIEHLSHIQAIGSVHPISAETHKLVNIVVESYHDYYGMEYEGISLEDIHVSMEKKEEGFFHAIGLIIAAIWKAIRNLFSNIWNFFKKLFGFAKNKKKKVKDKKKDIDNIKQEIHNVVKNPPETSSETSKPIYTDEDTFIKHVESALINKPIKTSDDNMLSHLLDEGDTILTSAYIRESTLKTSSSLSRFYDFVSHIYQNFDSTIVSSESVDQLNEKIANKEAHLLPELLSKDFEQLIEQIISYVYPVKDLTLFKEGFSKLNTENIYKKLPQLEDIRYFDSPYYGEHLYMFKIKEVLPDVKNEYPLFDCFKVQPPSKTAQVEYVPFSEAIIIWNDYELMIEHYEKHTKTNEKEFDKFSKTMEKWLTVIEKALTHNASNFENSFKQLGYMTPNHSVLLEKTIAQHQMIGSRIALALFRNYVKFTMKIFSEYSNYLAKLPRYFMILEETAGATITFFKTESVHFDQPDKLGIPKHDTGAFYSNR